MYGKQQKISGNIKDVKLFDDATKEKFESASVILICFDVMSKTSLSSACKKWRLEID